MNRNRAGNKKKNYKKDNKLKNQPKSGIRNKELIPSSSSGSERDLSGNKEQQDSRKTTNNQSKSTTFSLSENKNKEQCDRCNNKSQSKLSRKQRKYSSSKCRENENNSECYSNEKHPEVTTHPASKGIRKRLIKIPSKFGDMSRMPILVSTDSSERQSAVDTGLKKHSCDCKGGKISKHASPKKQLPKKRTSRKPKQSCSRSSDNGRKSKSKKDQNKNKNKSNRKRRVADVANTPSCPICCQEFMSPILLSCGHTFCKECVGVFVEASDGCSFACAVCEVEIILQGEEEELFCPNFMILKEMENDEDEEELQCSVCDSGNEAEFICVQCSDLLCEECSDAHRIVKFTRDHTVKEITSDIDLANYIKRRYYCNVHENEQLDIYCERCEKSICQVCALQSHGGEKHRCIPLQLAARTCRDETQKQLFNIKSRSPNLQRALMEIKNQKRILRDQANVTYAEISESFRRIMAVLKERERKLYKNLEDTYRKKLQVIKSEKEKVVLKLERFDVVSSMLQKLEAHDSDVEILQMKSTMKGAADNLLNVPAEHQLNLNATAMLFKSNESMIKEAIDTHGHAIRVKQAVDDDDDDDDDVVDGVGISTKNIKRLSILCDFSDQTNSNDGDDDDGDENTSATNNISLRSDAKKRRAKSNWRLVKSRIPDIATRYCVDSKRRDSEESLPDKTKEVSDARKERARANWLILRSYFNEVTTKNKQKERPLSSRSLSKVLTKKKRQNKAMRSRAIHQRATANWLLVRSKLPEIVIFGRVSGRLFTPLTEPSKREKRKRTSPTMAKLRCFRARTLRARANWLLVASRVHDIANYPKRKKSRKDKMTWDIYRSHLKMQRDRAGRNKYAAGKLRGITNWLIVKARLSDVILFGKYEYYKRLDALSSRPRSRSSSPRKHSKNRQHSCKSHGAIPDVFSRAQSRPHASSSGRSRPHASSSGRSRSRTSSKKKKFCSKKKLKAFANWDKLIFKTNFANKNKGTKNKNDRRSSQSSSKEEKSSTNWKNLVHSACAERLKNWDKLNNDTSAQNENKTLKHWEKLIRETSNNKDNLKHWDKLVKGTSIKKQISLKNWDKLINETSVNNEIKCLKNWDKLITATSVKAEIEGPKNWDKLIKLTPVKKEMNGLKNWNKLVNGTSVENNNSDGGDENLSKWTHLINGTRVTKSPNEIQKKVIGLEHLMEKDISHKWNTLISGTSSSCKKTQLNVKDCDFQGISKESPSKKSQSKESPSKETPYKKSQSSACPPSKKVERVQQEVELPYQQLNDGQSQTSSQTNRFSASKELRKNEACNGEKNFEKWDQLTNTTLASRRKQSTDISLITSHESDTETRYSSSEKHWHQLANTSKHEKPKAEMNWDKLISNASEEKKEAEKNWLQLVRATKSEMRHSTEQARERWHKVRESLADLDNPRPRNAAEMRRKTKEAAQKNWWRLIASVKTPKVLSHNSAKGNKKNDVIKTAVRNWNALISGTEIKASPSGNWMKLIQGTDANEDAPKEKKALENWQRLLIGALLNKREAEKDWHRLVTSTNTKGFDKAETNWQRLISSTDTSAQEKAKTNWHRLLQSVEIDRRELAEKHWLHLITMAPGVPGPKAKETAMKSWGALLEGRVRKPPERLFQHWENLIREENPYQTMDSMKPPPGIKILYDPSQASNPLQPKVVRLNIKNKSGRFEEVHVKMTSPDKSILSAHVQQNKDGTYTIFCCPTVQKNFNINVSLGGAEFKKETNVLNIKGSFANLKNSEETLAHRTIGLIRWHLTPGLLIQKGGRIIANNSY